MPAPHKAPTRCVCVQVCTGLSIQPRIVRRTGWTIVGSSNTTQHPGPSETHLPSFYTFPPEHRLAAGIPCPLPGPSRRPRCAGCPVTTNICFPRSAGSQLLDANRQATGARGHLLKPARVFGHLAVTDCCSHRRSRTNLPDSLRPQHGWRGRRPLAWAPTPRTAPTLNAHVSATRNKYDF